MSVLLLIPVTLMLFAWMTMDHSLVLATMDTPETDSLARVSTFSPHELSLVISCYKLVFIAIGNII